MVFLQYVIGIYSLYSVGVHIDSFFQVYHVYPLLLFPFNSSSPSSLFLLVSSLPLVSSSWFHVFYIHTCFYVSIKNSRAHTWEKTRDIFSPEFIEYDLQLHLFLCVYLYVLFRHSPTDGYLGWLYNLGHLDGSARNMDVYLHLWYDFGYILRRSTAKPYSNSSFGAFKKITSIFISLEAGSRDTV